MAARKDSTFCAFIAGILPVRFFQFSGGMA